LNVNDYKDKMKDFGEMCRVNLVVCLVGLLFVVDG